MQSLVEITYVWKVGVKMNRIITDELIENYIVYLRKEEKSSATMEKYARDLQKLQSYMAGRNITKELMIAYKKYLLEEQEYKITSINSFLVAANQFLEYQKWHDAKVKTYKTQKEAFCSDNQYLTREEYVRLVNTARKQKKIRLSFILQVLCATGMRISELSALKVKSVKNGIIVIHNKGKVRKILLPEELQKQLRYYIAKENIKEGVVFRTANGNPVNRSNIWKEMKVLCEKANVNAEKVFPHNLRHLFAQCFYQLKKDIAMLADLMGHSSIETTRLYIRTTSREHRKQLEQMGLVLMQTSHLKA